MMFRLYKIPLILIFFISCDSALTLSSGSSNSGAGDRNTQDSEGPNFPNITVNDFEKEIFKLVNAHRLAKKKIELKWHDQAIIESQDHSQDMAAFKVPFGHLGSSLRFQRIKAKDSTYISKLGENVAKNSSPKKAFSAWLKSFGHRKNIEGDYTHTGIGAFRSANGSWYFTQIFLKKDQ